MKAEAFDIFKELGTNMDEIMSASSCSNKGSTAEPRRATTGFRSSVSQRPRMIRFFGHPTDESRSKSDEEEEGASTDRGLLRT